MASSLRRLATTVRGLYRPTSSASIKRASCRLATDKEEVGDSGGLLVSVSSEASLLRFGERCSDVPIIIMFAVAAVGN